MARGLIGGWAFVAGVVGRLRGVGVARTAAALSFTTLLGLVPLLTVAVVFVTRYPVFQQWFDALERFLLRHLLPASGTAVRGYLVDFTTKAASLQGVSIALVAVTAFLLVATVEREIDAIWHARQPRSYLRRVFIYALGVTAGPLLIGAAVYSTSWLIEESAAQVPLASHAIPFLVGPLAVAITTLAFTLLYLLMPARPVPLKAAFAGGLFAALGFEVAKRGFAFYMATVPTYQIVYGALAALPLFLLWIYVSWVVVLIGAAVAATLAEGGRRGTGRRGL
ncbi:MAG: YihY family inner membrane protein [Betaproteobacteria bacterium]